MIDCSENHPWKNKLKIAGFQCLRRNSKASSSSSLQALVLCEVFQPFWPEPEPDPDPDPDPDPEDQSDQPEPEYWTAKECKYQWDCWEQSEGRCRGDEAVGSQDLSLAFWTRDGGRRRGPRNEVHKWWKIETRGGRPLQEINLERSSPRRQMDTTRHRFCKISVWFFRLLERFTCATSAVKMCRQIL